MKNYFDFILEKYGSNELVEKINDDIFDIINYNFGKILLNNNIILNNVIENDEIDFINDRIELIISDKNYARVNIDKLNIRNGVIEDLDIYIEFNVSDKERVQKQLNFDNKIKKNINHEIFHVIERYLTKLSDSKYAESWQYGKRLQELKNKYKEFDNILYFIYLSLPHEMRSRVSHVHQSLKNIKKDILIDFIKKTEHDETLDLIKNAKAVILLSRYEGQSMFITETLALGKPIIVTANNGMKDMIINGKNGIKVNEGDYVEASEAIKKIYAMNEKEVLNMGKESEKIYLEKYLPQTICRTFTDILEMIVPTNQ